MPTSGKKRVAKKVPAKTASELPQAERGGEPRKTTAEPEQYRVIENPHNQLFTVRLRCNHCAIEIEKDCLFYENGNCAKCHVPMSRVKNWKK